MRRRPDQLLINLWLVALEHYALCGIYYAPSAKLSGSRAKQKNLQHRAGGEEGQG